MSDASPELPGVRDASLAAWASGLTDYALAREMARTVPHSPHYDEGRPEASAQVALLADLLRSPMEQEDRPADWAVRVAYVARAAAALGLQVVTEDDNHGQ